MRQTFLQFLGTVTVGTAIVAGGFVVFVEVQDYIRTQQKNELALQRQLEESLAQIEALRQETLVSRGDLVSLQQDTQSTTQASQAEIERLEAQLRQETERAKEAVQKVQEGAQEELSEARQQIAELELKLSESLEPDVSAVIAKWKPLISAITCEFHYTNTGQLYAVSYGSGIATKLGLKPVVFTNKHVIVDENGFGPSSCSNFFVNYSLDQQGGQGHEYASLLQDIKVSGEEDWGYLEIPSADPFLYDLTSAAAQRCVRRPEIGERIIILGYPTIGSQNSITATEGIISGYEGDYFLASAKVEQGNSGGAALLVKDNCLLGIPTFAKVGAVESLARVLDISVIFD